MSKYYGNYFNKYESKNPLIRLSIKMFLNDLYELIKLTKAKRILDVGCGEGYVIRYIKSKNKRLDFEGIDVSKRVLNIAKGKNPGVKFSQGKAQKLKFKDNSFDLILCLEVLEHLKNPKKAIKELRRVSKKYIIVSVPNEPYWRMTNLIRFKYVNSLGNTPGHVQNWTKNNFIKFLKNSVNVSEIRRPAFLWTMCLCEK